MDRLDQLFARSKREIEAHVPDELVETETGRYFIDEAAHLLAGLRLWAQSQYHSDQVVRDILETDDVLALRRVVRGLRDMRTREATEAGWAVAEITKRSSGERIAVASYALRAL